MKRPPIFIVGAGRSGTTMLRDALNSHSEVQSLPYEINFVWHFGNQMLSHDFLDPVIHLDARIKSFIQTYFQKDQEELPVILDKTVANAARLRFVSEIFPNAKILHVVRDGRAVVASAMDRWQTPGSIGYGLDKLSHVPLRVLPGFLAANVAKRFDTRRKSSWGVRWPGIDQDSKDLSLVEKCARQWSKTVTAGKVQGRFLNKSQTRYLEIKYEDFVNEPLGLSRQILDHFELSECPSFSQHVELAIDPKRNDEWRRKLTEDDLLRIKAEAGPLLLELGYT
jgi:hypothetical protein